jgi:alpha-beta hydrolase superfamily lysophospholipase
MPFTVSQATQLKAQMPIFGQAAPVSDAFMAYSHAYGLGNLPAAQYTCGYYPLAGTLAQWGRVMAHHWTSPQQHRGTLCFAPGLFDHAGLFAPLFRFCLAQGFDVVCLEMPGHGLSDGDSCAIDSFATYAAIWQAFLAGQASALPRPWWGMGQSTGCTPLVQLGLSEACPFAGLVLLAPLVRPQQWCKVAITHALLGRLLAYVPRGLRKNSHDEAFNAFLFADVLQPQRLSVCWVNAMMHWVKQIPACSPAPNPLPVWLCQGTGDEVVDYTWNIPQLLRVFPLAQTCYIPGAKHHLANESAPFVAQLEACLLQALCAGAASDCGASRP